MERLCKSQGALCRAFSLMSVEEFVKDLKLGAPFDDEAVVGLVRGRCARTRFHQFGTLKGYVAPRYGRIGRNGG